MTMDDSTLSRQHSVPSRRCRMRDLSLERHSSMTEQTYQSGGRAKPTAPPSVPPDYYGTLTNRSAQGEKTNSLGTLSRQIFFSARLDDQPSRLRNGQNLAEIPV